jgi:RNA recognition motif-containing protein
MDFTAKPAVPTGLLLGDAGSREVPAAFLVYDEEKMRRKSILCPTKLFIGGISRHTTTKQLRDHFSQYGEVLDCIAMRAGDGRPRGFGYVTLDSPAAAQQCLHEPQLIDNRIVDMKLAVPESGASPKNGLAKQGGFNENMVKYGYGMWPGVDPCDDLSWWQTCPPQMSAEQSNQSLDCLQILSLTRESGALSAEAPEFVPFSETTALEACGQLRAPLSEITNVVKAADKPNTLKPSQGSLNVTSGGNNKRSYKSNENDLVFHIHEDHPEEVQSLGKNGFLLSPLKVSKSDLLLSPLPSSEEAKADILCNDGSGTSEASYLASDHDGSPANASDPSSDLDNLPSLGSALHSLGECKRCNFFAKGRCQNGKNCSFCHLPHEVRKLSRQEKRVRRDAKLHELTEDNDEGSLEHNPPSHLLRPGSLSASLFANADDDDTQGGDETYAYSGLPSSTPVQAMTLPSPLSLPSAKDLLIQNRPALPPGLAPPGLASPQSSLDAKDQTTPVLPHVGTSNTVKASLLSTTPSQPMLSSTTAGVPSTLLSTTPSSISASIVEAPLSAVAVRTIGTQTDEGYTCPRCDKRFRNSSCDVSEEMGGVLCASFKARCGGC